MTKCVNSVSKSSTEIDVNNLICLSNTLEASASASGTLNDKEKWRCNEGGPKRIKLEKERLPEIGFFRNSIQLFCYPRRKFPKNSAPKRKHDKRVAKAASEILFGKRKLKNFEGTWCTEGTQIIFCLWR